MKSVSFLALKVSAIICFIRSSFKLIPLIIFFTHPVYAVKYPAFFQGYSQMNAARSTSLPAEFKHWFKVVEVPEGVIKGDEKTANNVGRIAYNGTDKRANALELVNIIDGVLIKYASHKLTVDEAIDAMINVSLFESIGYVFFVTPSPFQLVSGDKIPDSKFLAAVIGGKSYYRTKLSAGTLGISNLLPGVISVEEPNILDEAGLRESEAEQILLKQYLLVLAEEIYHAIQYTLTNYGEYPASHGVLSDFFRSQNFEILNAMGENWVEADVYAKLLETLGSDLVPSWFDELYSERSYINRAKVGLLRENITCSGILK